MNKILVLNSNGCYTFSGALNLPAYKYTEDALIKYTTNHPAILLLEGGNDINPALYNATQTYTRGISKDRDAREIALYHFAREHNIPILGICRGHQLMAALAGGDLYQDIGKELGKGHSYEHDVLFTEVARDVGFTDLMESNPTGRPDVVNSLHHQAVKRVPDKARVLAFHVDTTPEALWYPWGVSVQWHPEFLGHEEFVEYVYTRFKK